MRIRLLPVLAWLILFLGLFACQFSINTSPTPITRTTPELSDDSLVMTETLQVTTKFDPTLSHAMTSTGASPSSHPIYTKPRINEISMFTPLQGWALANDHNVLVVTEDGGITWQDVTPGGGQSHILTSYFLDEKTAWVASSYSDTDKIYHTQDGGMVWDTSPLPFDHARFYFLDSHQGFALVDLGAGAGSHYIALYQSEDAGASWVEVFSHIPGESKSLPESGAKNGVTFLDKHRGWVGGSVPMTDYFYFYATTDGGVSWTQEADIMLPKAHGGSFLDVYLPIFLNEDTGYLPVRAVNSENELFLLIYRSDDSGATWHFQNAIRDGRKLVFTDVGTGFLTTGDGLYQTQNGGVTWSSLDTDNIPVGEYILDIAFTDSQHGWLLTTPNKKTWTPRNLYRTTDGGSLWMSLLP